MYRKTMIAAACSTALVACTPAQQQTLADNQRTAIGAVTGAAVGAAAGTLFGGNDRRNALIGAGVGTLAGAAVGNYLDRQQRALQQDLAGTGAEVERRGDELLVTFPSNITFATDSAQIQPQFYPVLNDVARTLNQYPESFLDIIGHTDSTGTAEYNQALSERRAAAVANYFRSQGVVPQRLAAYGVGETQPVASNETPQGRQENRRVELRIIPATQQY